MSGYDGIRIVPSAALPLHPSAGEDGKRIVRHGLADVLRWLGEEVGRKPGEPIQCFHMVQANVLLVSHEVEARLRDAIPLPWGVA